MQCNSRRIIAKTNATSSQGNQTLQVGDVCGQLSVHWLLFHSYSILVLHIPRPTFTAVALPEYIAASKISLQPHTHNMITTVLLSATSYYLPVVSQLYQQKFLLQNFVYQFQSLQTAKLLSPEMMYRLCYGARTWNQGNVKTTDGLYAVKRTCSSCIIGTCGGLRCTVLSSADFTWGLDCTNTNYVATNITKDIQVAIQLSLRRKSHPFKSSYSNSVTINTCMLIIQS